MATDTAPEVYDLLLLVDATYSMSDYLQSLQISLPKVIAISKLTNSFSRIGLLAYRDYTEANRRKDGMLEWSGWLEEDDNQDRADMLMKMAANLEPIGGGDFPEATKTGLAKAYELMREEATTIVLLYTDAPPHCWMVADKDPGNNYMKEQRALLAIDSYDGHGPDFADWVSAAKKLRRGARKAQVFCFLDRNLSDSVINGNYYTYISTVTKGACFAMSDSKPHTIAEVTVDVLLAWMGAGKAGVENTRMSASLARYVNGDDIRKIKDEKDPIANKYFWAHEGNYETRLLNLGLLKSAKDAHKREWKTLVTDFAQRYAKDERFKRIVVDQLKSIIETDVSSMALNPVFGALWRAVCNDRENAARNELITAFGLHVDKISNTDEKARMRNWLEESYDYAAENLNTLEAVPDDQKFPCVFLDPTIEFSQARKRGEKDDEDEDEENQPVTAFRRDELLEIGRSCDGRILRRLGKVLTRITYVESAEELPAHIATTTNAEVPKIPIALASQANGWKFWKLLLHTVLPGTMLASRPAVVLAALAIRIGLKPLFGAASAALLFWRDKWNNIEVPETWNSSCLGLLLDADAEYRKQVKSDDDVVKKDSGLLLDFDRELFTRLIAYHHAGANLLTTLAADIGWTPDKSQIPVGPAVLCRGCDLPRSVTIMVEKSGGKCGLCVARDFRDAEHKSRALAAHVTKQDTSSTNATWVECIVRTCRAQYVCYNPEDLNVRPKCHYCRNQTSLATNKRSDDPAPTLECGKCLNKVICPFEYRSAIATPFQCPACASGRKTIDSVSTNAKELCKENGQDWLLENKNNTVTKPFERSVFHTIYQASATAFLANVTILPSLSPEPTLTIRGKRLHNQTAIKASLNSWIHARNSEKSPCSLCFSDFHPSRLLPACRRRGCHQSICEGCLKGWYGLNGSGTIINTAALFCPFCRRPPAARTLAAYGMGIHAVGNLQTAVAERGQWIHAWCSTCGNAKRYMERECARGAPDATADWKCEDCNLAAAEQELDTPIKECPGCKTPTVKLGGCNHITCTVRQCHTHWCWECGKKFNSRDIYPHMAQMHGSMYGQDDGDDYD
ncbi:dihydroxyacid dehydratase [Dendryphion nanum]|uniref:RBR-type E3 ubiquitin transferase n=1 Tax=Dendryphion nanum TaxID=256645 RepID=A0A9P9CZB0_9PLEO|nr:dihydroxyacid dehydratase [Dendryphion nanum]